MSNSSLVSYTRISPNRTSPRKNTIDTITIHCVVGQVTAERLGEIFANPDRQASSNYGVDKDGRVGMYCEESDRSWCSGTGNAINTNDHRAITIEVASDTKSPYAVTEQAYNGLIALCTEICKRHGKKGLLFLGNRSATEAAYAKGESEYLYLTAHKWYADTQCPGEYLYSRFGEIARLVTEAVAPDPTPTTPTITFPVIAVQKGSQGEDAKRVQEILKGMGFYSGIIDGDAATKTVAAIKAYQQKFGLYLDGVWGEKCWSHWLGL